MKLKSSAIAATLAVVLAAPAFAQTAATTVQRDVNQQQRIEQGLQGGSLSTGEAASLERKETHVENLQSGALKNGSMSPAERARIQGAQDRVSKDIDTDKHNARAGNPASASSQRMQAGVQRNVDQQARIEQGVKSGQLTHRETASLEHGQAKVTRREARAGADGHVSATGATRIARAENHQSDRIYANKHDAQVRP